MVLPIFLTSCNTLLVCFFILSDMPLMVASIYQVVIFSCCRPIIISFIAVSSFLVVLQFFFLCLVVMSFYCLVTMKLCRFFIVFRFQPVILSSCRKITFASSILWSLYHLVILSSCCKIVLSSSIYGLLITLSSCHPVIKSPCHHLFTQSSITISSSIYDLLTKLVIMSLPPLVTIHISYYFVILLSCYCTVVIV